MSRGTQAEVNEEEHDGRDSAESSEDGPPKLLLFDEVHQSALGLRHDTERDPSSSEVSHRLWNSLSSSSDSS
jgi:hypothetical protein